MSHTRCLYKDRIDVGRFIDPLNGDLLLSLIPTVRRGADIQSIASLTTPSMHTDIEDLSDVEIPVESATGKKKRKVTFDLPDLPEAPYLAVEVNRADETIMLGCLENMSNVEEPNECQEGHRTDGSRVKDTLKFKEEALRDREKPKKKRTKFVGFLVEQFRSMRGCGGSLSKRDKARKKTVPQHA